MSRVRARSTYQAEPGTLGYVEDVDFTLNRADGTLRAPRRRAFPISAPTCFTGRKVLIIRNFPGYGNAGFLFSSIMPMTKRTDGRCRRRRLIS